MASPASLTTSLRAAARDRLAPSATLALRATWLLLQLGALTLALATTPTLYARYQTTCPAVICDQLPQPTAESVALLGRLGIPLAAYATATVAAEWIWLLLWLSLGAVILWKQPRDPVGLPLAYAGLVIGIGSFSSALNWSRPDFHLPDLVANVVIAVSLPLVIGLFPDGRWVPRWTRWIALIATIHGVALEFVGPVPTGALRVLDIPLNVIMLAVLLGAQIYRYRRVSSAIQRQQAKWLLFGIGLIILAQAVALGLFALDLVARYQVVLLVVGYGADWSLVLAIGFAVLRYRLFDIDVIINRALVYGSLTIGAVGVYILIVGYLGTLFRTSGNLAVSFLATGVVAVLFQPLRERLQRGVNRLLYGQRDEPYTVISRLGQRLGASLAPDAVLPTIVETVAGALKLPYAAIALQDQGEATVAAEYGVSGPGVPIAVPLTYQGEAVGELRLAPRPGERALAPADRVLVDDLARQAGIAIHAVQLTRELQRARARLVTAREEERRRLRRDLHDGLGPALASQALTVDTAALLLTRDPEAAALLLREVKAQSQAAVAEIRRVVYALRPPALDDLGLVGALREGARQYAGAGLEVTFVAPDPLPPLPAAVEVAIYRIAQEALTNVARHAQARHCTITIAVGATLELVIADDGVGIAADRRAGVGLTSMRERAEELGGTCEIGPDGGGGSRLAASLPLEGGRV